MITDVNGISRQASIFSVLPGEIQYYVPPETAPGTAKVTVASFGRARSGTVSVALVSPGLFQSDSTTGRAAADVLQISAATEDNEPAAKVVQSALSDPIDLERSDTVYLVLYGTGIRRAKEVTAMLGTTAVPVAFFGNHDSLTGLDQINVGPLPKSLLGAGQVDVLLSADGIAANTVNVTFK
jgi:uncharacterized protein (TIGR03437 family)